MQYSMTKLIASIAIAVCLALPANAGDEQLEDKYAAKYGRKYKIHNKITFWR